MVKPTLWVLVGLSGSGKSTVASQIAKYNQNTVIISTDAIREELCGNCEDQRRNKDVFNIFYKRILKNLKNNKNVIADATNITVASRYAILSRTSELNIHKRCVVVSKPFEQCKEDNTHREHSVPDAVLEKQYKKFCLPTLEENWDEILFYDANKYYSPDLSELFETNQIEDVEL